MGYSLSHFFSQRENAFSYFWFRIVETRFWLCIFVAISSFFIQGIPKVPVFVGIAIYFLINLLSGFIKQPTLQQKRFRIIPAIIDIVFASFLIYFTGGQNSPWFLLYIFPTVSVSRYLSYEGSIPLALSSIAAYIFVVLISAQSVEVYSLLLKSMLLLGIGFVIGNLTRAKSYKDDNLIEIFKEIDEAIINSAETDNVLKLILEKALILTKSDIGQLKILSDEGTVAETISLFDNSFPEIKNTEIESITKRWCEKVLASKKPVTVRFIKTKKSNINETVSPQQVKENSNRTFITFIEKSKNLSGTALFVPLILNEKVIGIIAVYTKGTLHYFSKNEAINLGNFAPLLGIALKNSNLYQEILNSENEKKERLRMLYEIGEQLKVEQELPDIFQKVVELVYNRLNSEESALFIWDEKTERIEKKAVQGPSKEITKKLERIEKPYKKGESIVGKIFKEKTAHYKNFVEDKVKHKAAYSKTLPSRDIQHYIGVPLIIGEEVLGVIRVLNKRAADYSIENNNFALSEEGFDEEDFELMQTLASQVAFAIRSAKFIEIQRYYQELIENSPDPIIVLDEEGKIKIFNKACEKIWGFSANDVIGESVKLFYKSEEHAVEIGRTLRDSPNKRIQDFDAWIKDYKKEIIPISLSASLLFDKEGKRIGSIGVFKDLRETLKLQEEKTTAEILASIGKIAHILGHEIKHDIGTALFYIETLAFQCTDENLAEIYSIVQDSLGEAKDKFQNMLMVGKPKPPDKQLIGAYDIFQKIEPTMRQRAHSEKIDFLIKYPADDYDLVADNEQLKQVLMNLFNNSIDAIKKNRALKDIAPKGIIELSASSNNGDLQIILKDNGCGISSQNISEVFIPFVTDKETGSGLGLFIVKSIIENHGGEITIESEEGNGTSFNIVLPLFTEEGNSDKNLLRGEF